MPRSRYEEVRTEPPARGGTTDRKDRTIVANRHGEAGPLTLVEGSGTIGEAGAIVDPPSARVPDIASELKPCARLLDAGAAALSSAELLGVLLGNEGADDLATLRLAEDLVSGAGGLAKLRAASYDDLAGADGTLPAKLTPARASRILAAAEIGRRMMEEGAPEAETISSPAHLNRLLAPRLRDLEQEQFVAVLLGTRNQVLSTHTIAIGTLSSCQVHPREVFKPAIKAAAAGVILAHNHPAGHLKPSHDDLVVTRRLVKAGETIGIDVLDHLIIAKTGYASLSELGLLKEN